MSNLAQADVTMEKITEVTGHTQEVARECYLKLSSDAQRETMMKLGEIYGVVGQSENYTADARRRTENEDEFTIRLNRDEAEQLSRFLQTLTSAEIDKSGTKSGTNQEKKEASSAKSKGKKEMVDRVGFEPT